MQLTRSLQRSKSLYEQTYEALRGSILAGELQPGDRLIETQLAEQLQVSRTPIREAIRQLQRESLVTADANGWLRVITVSLEEAKQLYDCRIALETLAVSEACGHAQSVHLKRLKYLIEKAEQATQQQCSESNSQQLLELDYEFHHVIAESSQNYYLIGLLDQVFSKMTLLRLHTTRHNPRVLEICAEHQQIYAAVAQHDVDAAVAAIRSHLIASKARVVQELSQIGVG